MLLVCTFSRTIPELYWSENWQVQNWVFQCILKNSPLSQNGWTWKKNVSPVTHTTRLSPVIMKWATHLRSIISPSSTGKFAEVSIFVQVRGRPEQVAPEIARFINNRVERVSRNQEKNDLIFSASFWWNLHRLLIDHDTLKVLVFNENLWW